MIEHLRGQLAELTPTQAVVECCGVGYGVNISLNTYSALQGRTECKLYISEVIREDAHVLYGFGTREERELFLLLVTVPGIGGNTARMILSSFSPDELVAVITAGNANALKAVKGIGLKTAQRVLVDLKDKVGSLGAAASAVDLSHVVSDVADEAVSALTMLGFSALPSKKVVNAILSESPGLSVENIIKQALKRL
ncbi:MAG TPA: Holliday junction branch migration protein RuvA [Candidatus Avibacteroides faecavium]|nr:Holliday junction branch migration protein RuvA [Candidatus Avibacteroides faecavium]